MSKYRIQCLELTGKNNSKTQIQMNNTNYGQRYTLICAIKIYLKLKSIKQDESYHGLTVRLNY